MNQETKIQRQIMLALSDAGCMVFRNETAGAWVGKPVYQDSDTVTLKQARFMQFGLCIGSADIIGLTPDGKFLAVEVKTKTGRASLDQSAFLENIKKQGGKAFIARSPQEALEGLFND